MIGGFHLISNEENQITNHSFELNVVKRAEFYMDGDFGTEFVSQPQTSNMRCFFHLLFLNLQFELLET